MVAPCGGFRRVQECLGAFDDQALLAFGEFGIDRQG
jgi:hypothetical protein